MQQQQRSNRYRIGCLPILLLTIVGGFLAYKALEYNFRLNLVPDKLGVRWISYVETDRLGTGPGGLETGVIVYDLPEKAAQEILDKGMEFFADGRPSHSASGELLIYERWHPSPVEIGPLGWEETRHLEGSLGSQVRRIADFLNRHGLGIDLAPWLERMIDEAIVSPGNYYFYGRSGVTIVIPSARQVVFAYAG